MLGSDETRGHSSAGSIPATAQDKKQLGGQMPTYEFKCLKCHLTLEQHFTIDDEPTMRCFECQEEMVKQFTPPAIHFKGDGWGGK